ncbi:hypothetical protein E6H24_01415 [Candidatus Bathyarchaeota archaeon]|nr:MAG: hypothetical protein E6H24_01415 [Candidatus Bathyarchaeota archaeon]
MTAQISTVHGAPPLIYTLTLSTSRIQEVNSPGVTMTLNVSNTVSGSFYGFSWNVTDPSGSIRSFVYYVAANGPFLTLAVVYPRDFSGALVKYNGTYRINIFQTYPNPTALVATGRFYTGLTDSLSYQRTAQVFILAQGYASNENITMRILHAGIPASGFPISQLADGNGVFSYLWPIPVSTPLGDINVSLSGQVTVKKPPDSQIFTILPTSVSISQLVANLTLLQGSRIAAFSFAAVYPDGSQAKTGTTTIRVLEPDGITIHLVSMTYNTTVNAFEGTYRIASSDPSGGWAAIIDANSFDDVYGNVGPSTGVVRGFVVEPAASQNPQTSTVTYLLLMIVVLLAVALTFLVSWVLFFARKKVQRSVLKVDLQSIEREAARVQNRDFFGKVRDQLKQRQQAKPEEGAKDG